MIYFFIQVLQSSQSSTKTETLPSHSQREQSSSQIVQQSDPQSSSTVNPLNETLTVAVEQSHSSAEASTTNGQAPSTSLQDQRSSSRTAVYNRPQTSQTNKRKRLQENETLTALERLENIATAINNPGNEQKDEFYYFGQSIAAQLRSLPLNNALDMQAKIQLLLSAERSQLSTSYS